MIVYYTNSEDIVVSIRHVDYLESKNHAELSIHSNKLETTTVIASNRLLAVR